MPKLARVNYVRTLYDTSGTNNCKRVDVINPGEIVLVFEETIIASVDEAYEVFVLTALGQTGWIVNFTRYSGRAVETFA